MRIGFKEEAWEMGGTILLNMKGYTVEVTVEPEFGGEVLTGTIRDISWEEGDMLTLTLEEFDSDADQPLTGIMHKIELEAIATVDVW